MTENLSSEVQRHEAQPPIKVNLRACFSNGFKRASNTCTNLVKALNFFCLIYYRIWGDAWQFRPAFLSKKSGDLCTLNTSTSQVSRPKCRDKCPPPGKRARAEWKDVKGRLHNWPDKKLLAYPLRSCLSSTMSFWKLDREMQHNVDWM